MNLQGRSLTKQRAGAVAFLQRRLAYLTQRIEQAGAGARSFDKSERTALQLAIADAARCDDVVTVLTGPGTDAEKLARLRAAFRLHERDVGGSQRVRE